MNYLNFKNKLIGFIVVLTLISLVTCQAFAETGKTFQPPDDVKLQKILDDFEAYAVKGMKQRKIPGMVIAIVKDDKIIYKKGFGVRKVGSNEPVNEDTIFQIGSTSKAFTSALVSMLVDEGKINWNDRVIDHLPDFRMYDPWVTREFRIKDLMAQHSGMVAYSGDAQSFVGFDRDHIIKSIRYIKPITGFRTEFGYQNNLFLVAAKLVEKKTGKSWEENVREKILNPLGMTETTIDINSFRNEKNAAFLHRKTNGVVKAYPMNWKYLSWTYTYAPAGGINSNIIDMAKWLQMQMNSGKFDDKRIVSEKNLEFTHSPQTIAGARKGMPMQYYCEAWIYRENNPYPIIWHNGGTSGHNTMVAFVPKAKIGIIVIANMSDQMALPDLLAFRFFDMYFGNPSVDWNAKAMKMIENMEKEAEKKAPKRPASPVPARKQGSYTGEYQNKMYGKITVSAENKGLSVTIGPKKAKIHLKHWDGDTFSVIASNFPIDEGEFATFEIDPNGKANKLTIDMLNYDGCGVFGKVEKETK